MNTSSKQLNQLYLKEMEDASEASVLARLKKYWWPHFIKSIDSDGVEKSLDKLDEFMKIGNDEFRKSASDYTKSKGHPERSPKYIQAINQYLKSNTGKMFERFIGLSLAQSLHVSEANYCVLPFRKDTVKYCHNLKKDDFEIKIKLGGELLLTHIDSDLFAFNPINKKAPIYLISVKSTLKDRFHNVPFWNLLRQAAVSKDFTNIKPKNLELLSKLKYVSASSDLAEEQPDFASESGPRNMLCVDAALLDGAFVSAKNAIGLGEDANSLGPNRVSAFYPLSSFFKILS